MPKRSITLPITVGRGTVPRETQHRRRRRTAYALCLVLMVPSTVLLPAGAVLGQDSSGLADYPAVPPEQLADVIVVIKPHATLPLHLPIPADRVVQGDIVRLEKGPLPVTIVHTRNTMGAPVRAGVPVKLYLKAFKDGHAHYIINISHDVGGLP